MSDQSTVVSENEERFQIVFNHSNDLIFLVDAARDLILDANHKACSMLGYSREELLSLALSAIHPNEMPKLMAFAQSVNEYGSGWTDELTCMTKAGEVLPAEISASMVDIQGSPCMIAIVRDISERKRAALALRESEERYRYIYDNMPVMMDSVDRDGRLQNVNAHWLELLGYDLDEVIGRKPTDFLTPNSQRYMSEVAHPKLLETGFVEDVEMQMVKKDGGVIEALLTGVVQRDRAGEIIGAFCFILDVTARKQAEEAEQRWTEESTVLAEIGRTVSASLDINEVYENLGGEIRKLVPFDRFGLSLVDSESGEASPIWVLGTDVPGRHTGDAVPLTGSLVGEVVRTKSPILLEVQTAADVEHKFPQLISSYNVGLRSFMAVPLHVSDGVIGVLQIRSKKQGIYTQRHLNLLERVGSQIAGAIANSRLYAQQKDSEARITRSLNEKEVLLKEVHHRVKNNLQVISSLLNLQSRNIDDGRARDILKESRNRVRAMALIHEQLYQSEDLMRIPFGRHIRKLTSDLYQTYQVDSGHVTLDITAGDILLGIDMAIPCGLIINELVSNSLKHAFPAGVPGEILIALEVDQERNFALTVSDNGVGIPDGLDLRNAESLGMQLVSSLADQLGATVEIDGSRGTRFTITFMYANGEEEFI